MIHGKYGAGDIDGVPYSSAGLILANGSQKGGKPVSYTGLIAYMRKKGSMYVGTTNWDLFYKQLMMIIYMQQRTAEALWLDVILIQCRKWQQLQKPE